MGSFVFRWPHAANEVHVTGTFDDWGKTEQLEKVGDVFEKEVNLPSADEKYYYKFVVDDNIWTTDHEAPQEDDGHYNVNNVLLPANIKRTTVPMPNDVKGTGASRGFSLPTFKTVAEGLAGAGSAMYSSVTSRSTTADPAGSVPKEGQGSPTLSSVTPQSTTADLAGAVPKEEAGPATLSSVTPQSTTADLAGAVPKEGSSPAVGSPTEEDGDTLGGDDFSGEKRATTVPEESERSHLTPGAFPETPANEPADFDVKPIPASEGTGNPISVPAGEKLPDQSAINSNTVDSTATTSKEGYEKDASAVFPMAVAAAAGVGGAAGAATYEHEKKPEADSFGVNPIPASSGIGNPISVPAGEKLPEQSSFNPNTVQSTATTSKEGYENDEKDDEDSFGVKPIPASSGIGNPISIPVGEKLPEQSSFNPNTVESTATTSKEDYEKDETDPVGVKPIPASSGIGNPITVPAGEKLPEESSFNPNTVDSTATTSKEGYERDASAALLAGGAAAGIGGAGLYKSKEDSAADSAFSVPEKSKNMIPESSLPMGDGAKDTMDAGPFIQSAAPQSSSYYMASTVPFEPKREATVIDDDEPPSATLSGPAPTVPEMVKESMSEAHQSPEAASSPEVVEEKKSVESELLKEVKTTDAVGEPAPSATSDVTGIGSAATSSVPEIVKESMLEAHESPEAAVSSEAVKEKAAVESELLKEVKTTDAIGEPAPTVAAATSETAPAATGKSGLFSADPVGAAVPPALLESKHAATFTPATPGIEVVNPMSGPSYEKPTTAAIAEEPFIAEETSKPIEPEGRDLSPMSRDPNAPATQATTTATPTKKTPASVATGTTPKSAASSPASTATQEHKKKNRRSFFGKLKDKLKDL